MASRSERSAHQARDAHAADERILRDKGPEERLHLSANDLAAYLAVDSIKGFGPQKFRELFETGPTPTEVVASPTLLQLGLHQPVSKLSHCKYLLLPTINLIKHPA